MAINDARLSRKLRKLVTKPDRFFSDLLRKRTGEVMSVMTNGDLSFDTTDYQVADGTVIITAPQVVAALQKLKASRKLVKVRLSWKG
jgi:hypothetical protein